MAFLDRFFPKTKYMSKRREISSVQQEDGENLYDACKRYEMILKRCMGHNFSEMEITDDGVSFDILSYVFSIGFIQVIRVILIHYHSSIIWRQISFNLEDF